VNKMKRTGPPEQKRPKAPQRSASLLLHPQPEPDPTVGEKERAVGALLAFYRRVRGKSREDLFRKVSISNALLSRIESGERLPTHEVLDRLCEQLELTPFESFQLRAIAGYERKYNESPESAPLACDVLRGGPLFLRTAEDEREFFLKSDFPQVWIVSPSPLVLDPKFFDMLKAMLLDKQKRSKYKYVWFLDKKTGADDAAILHERLNSDQQLRKKGIVWSQLIEIEFVLCPSSLCIASPRLAIYNPREEGNTQMFGRAFYVSGGRPVGLYALDDEFVKHLASFLREMYDGCKNIADLPDPWYPQEPELAKKSGTFRFMSLKGPLANEQFSNKPENN
jgi:transcriptional regulator with XRE-family HTH domain